MLLKNELQSIISGTGVVTKGTAIKAVANHLRKSKAASKNAEEKEFIKEQEAKVIIEYSSENDLFSQRPNEARYLAQGAEQKVYLNEDNEFVTKFKKQE